MPVQFLSDSDRDHLNRFPEDVTQADLDSRSHTILCYNSLLARISGWKFFQILEIFLVDFCNLCLRQML